MSLGPRTPAAFAPLALAALIAACSRFEGSEAASDPGDAAVADAASAPVADGGGAPDAVAAPFACPTEPGWGCTTFDQGLELPSDWSVTDRGSVVVVGGAGPTPPNQLRVVAPATASLNARLYRVVERASPPRMTFRFEAAVSGCRGCEIAALNQYDANGQGPLCSVYIEVDGGGMLQLHTGQQAPAALGPIREGWHAYELRVTGSSIEALVDGTSAGKATASWGPVADRIEISVGVWRVASGEAGQAFYDDVAYRLE